MKIALHGISGSGKTTVGRLLVEQLNAQPHGALPFTHIDQDSYYLPDKPRVRLSTGEIVKNWDTLEALDIGRLQRDLTVAKKVVCSGFALRREVGVFDINILLDTSTPVGAPTSTSIPQASPIGAGGASNSAIITERCAAARQVSKGFSGPWAVRDRRIVEELVLPYFLQTLQNVGIDKGHLATALIVPVYTANAMRRGLPEILGEIGSSLERFRSPISAWNLYRPK